MTSNNEQKLHFFVIDDDEIALEQISRLLTKSGHKVSGFTSAKNVLKEIIKHQPDCVLSDLWLPKMDGIDFYQIIRQTKDIKQPIFIIITGKQFEYDRR